MERKGSKGKGRFLFVTLNEGVAWGGSEELWFRAANCLDSQGYEVYISAPVRQKESGRHAFFETKRRIKYRRRSLRDFPRLLRSALGRNTRVTPGVGNFRSWARSIRPDLVVISDGVIFNAADLVFEAVEVGVPIILLSQANLEGLWLDDITLFQWQRVLAKMTAIYFVSDHNRRLAQLQVAGELKGARVIRNPVNITAEDIEKTQAIDPDQEPVNMACVARMHFASKGQDVLLESLSQAQWRDRHFILNFYGTGPQEATVRGLVRYFGLESHVKIHGQVSDVGAIWRDNSMLVLPSRYEGLPLALVEAMLCGRVPVVTDVGGTSELVDDGVTGFLAHAPTVPAFANALERAWRSKDNWAAIARSAQAVATARYSEDPGEAFARELAASIGARAPGVAM